MFKRLLDRISGGNTLYYPGCMTKFVLGDIEEKYRKLLNRLGVDYIVLKDVELCCGSPVYNAGYVEDFEELKQKNMRVFGEYDVKKIISNCPGCVMTFRDHYGLDARHVSQVVAEKAGKLDSNQNLGEVTYHDPCHLGRFLGVYDEPRMVLEKRGFKVKEIPYNRRQSLCCGGGAGMRQNDRKTSDEAACDVLGLVETKKLVASCPMCYYHFKENSKTKKVYEFVEMLE